MNLQPPPRIVTALCASETDDQARIVIALNATEGSLPDWVELIPAGPLVQGYDGRNWIMPDAQIVVDASKAWAASAGSPLDEGHATQLSQKHPACGWFTDFRVGATGGIEAKVEWTELGEGFVKRREYRFISVAFDYDFDSREILVCIGGGLVNNHNLRVGALNQKTKPTEDIMDPKLMAALGIVPSGIPATDLATALNAIQKLQNEHTTALNAQKDLVPRADLETALNATTAAEQKLKDRDADEFTAKVETAVNAAIEGKKVTPGSKDWYLGAIKDEPALNTFEEMIGKTPAIIPAGVVTPTGTPDGTPALNAAEKELGRVFGNSAEDLKKYGDE